MKKVGTDLDGIITPVGLYNPNLKLPSWLFIFWLPLVLVPPKRKAVERLRLLKQEGTEIIIVSARPSWVKGLTKILLGFYKVPFTKLYCIGFGKGTEQRKLDIIVKEGIKQFFDDDKRLVKFLNCHFIKANTDLNY